jgi:hypothetical protein
MEPAKFPTDPHYNLLVHSNNKNDQGTVQVNIYLTTVESALGKIKC